jgi:NAD(P)H dehydrogenase (quinone)
MVIAGLPYAFARQADNSTIVGGSPYGASTNAGGSGERKPSDTDLAGARFQGKYVALLASAKAEIRRCLRVLALSGHLSRKAGFTLYFNMGIFSDGPLKGASSRSSESPAWTIWCIYLILSG